MLRSERYYGRVSRSIALAGEVDDSAVTAKYADGVLTLQLPKRAVASTKRIAIQ